MNHTRSIALLVISSLILVAAQALPSIASTPFSIHWTAPGDDSLMGRASIYDLRYSNVPITPANFHQAAQIVGLPVPAPAGTTESFVVSGLPDRAALYLTLRSADEVGNWSTISNTLIRPGQTTFDDPQALLSFSFSSPWPNPARGSAHWVYSMPQTEQVHVDVFDVNGRHVRSIASGQHEAGRGNLSWDLLDHRGQPVGAGVYLVKARLGVMEWTKRLVVVR